MVTEAAISNKNFTFLYRFLVNPELRWLRYLVLILILSVISFNQAFIVFIDYQDILGGWIYAFAFIFLLSYIAVVYLNLFLFFPKYLLKRRYLTYLSLLSVAMIVALLMQLATEYFTYAYWPEMETRQYYFSTQLVMDYISSFMLSTLCMIGGTMTVLLKEWTIDHQRVSQMEKAHVLSEVELLKEQVSPELLFNTLHRSGQLTMHEPEKASKMLMKLSQLLRYQLYDCSRAKVLLSSEISFLTNYLTLEQDSRPHFSYVFTSEGEVNRMLVPPLLFIPFVQHIVKLINDRQTSDPVNLNIHLKAEDGTIQFTCICPEVNLSSDKGLERIIQRLNLLYGNRYGLLLIEDRIQLELKGGE